MSIWSLLNRGVSEVFQSIQVRASQLYEHLLGCPPHCLQLLVVDRGLVEYALEYPRELTSIATIDLKAIHAFTKLFLQARGIIPYDYMPLTHRFQYRKWQRLIE